MTAGRLAALIAGERLPTDYAETVARCWVPLAARIAALAAVEQRPLLVMINGAQGTGKSTLCGFVAAILGDDHGLATATLSLDDVYLTKAARQLLARDVHPLFATRGPPGTHDLVLAERTIAALLNGSGTVAVPRFDKATDDRVAPADWPVIAAPVDVLLVEGWCIGATPEGEAALAKPVNALERDEDPDGIWRRAVNVALAAYQPLFARRDLLVMLEPPGFDAVLGWRQLQEAKLIARTGRGMAPGAVARFVAHYERLTRHMLATLPQLANIVLPVDAAHRVGALTVNDAQRT